MPAYLDFEIKSADQYEEFVLDGGVASRNMAPPAAVHVFWPAARFHGGAGESADPAVVEELGHSFSSLLLAREEGRQLARGVEAAFESHQDSLVPGAEA